MEAFVTGLIVLALIIGFLGIGTWVFAGLLLVSVTALTVVLDFPPQRIGAIVTKIMFRSATAWELAAIPMFVWMGEMMFRPPSPAPVPRARAAGRRHRRGACCTPTSGCTQFAAVSGSVGRDHRDGRQDHHRRARAPWLDTGLAIGSLAGAGSLGLLIPPSIVMIIYGVLADGRSQVLAAGVFPRLIIAALYSGYISAPLHAAPGSRPAPARPTAGATGSSASSSCCRSWR